jgi:hypothetical protein
MTEFLVGSINLKLLTAQQGSPTTCLMLCRSLRRETTKCFRFKGCPASYARIIKWVTVKAVVASVRVQSSIYTARKNLSIHVEIQIRDLLKRIRRSDHSTAKLADCNTCLFTIFWLTALRIKWGSQVRVFTCAIRKVEFERNLSSTVLPSRSVYWRHSGLVFARYPFKSRPNYLQFWAKLFVILLSFFTHVKVGHKCNAQNSCVVASGGHFPYKLREYMNYEVQSFKIT